MHRIDRRQMNKAAAAALGVALLGEDEAEANPLFWAVARWVGLGIASWALSKALDKGYDYLTRFSVEKDREDALRVTRSPDTVVTLTNRVEAGRVGEPAQTIDNCLFSAFRRHQIALADAFAYWGRPTSVWTVRQLPDGFLIAQWWTPYEGDRRYVVTRTYDSGNAFHYLAFRERNGASRVAEEVVNGGEPSRPRMRILFHEPKNFEHDPREDPPGPS